jgi:penicillin amidase
MLRLLARLLLLLPLLVAAALLWLRSSLPEENGRLVTAGISADISISRDAQGIPTIRAANDRDAAFALGYVHAQDRLFQMDLMRRAGAGRLAEWFGPRAVFTDRFMRTLGLYRAAERQYAILSPGLRAELDAYAAGVNAYLTQRRQALPPEYYLVNARPETWRPADTLVWGKFMALQLAGNFRTELLHARVARQVTPAELDVLYPGYPRDAPTTLAQTNAWLHTLPLEAIYAALPDFVGPHHASNNWVVDGKHSQSGKPLLANDPHLGFSAPSVWYLARIETPENTLAGVTAPGGPFLVLGHNRRIAWGFTNTESDVEDLFIERVDPADATHYLTPEGSEPFVLRNEEILVRGANPVELTVRVTRHGPVISDLGGSYGDVAESGTVLALQTPWLMDGDHTPDALRAMNRATDWDSFRSALRDFTAPEQNIVYADIDGNIGFIAPARVPIRGKGDGWMPVPGWTGDYDWAGYIPFDQLPMGFNPPSGRFVSANNKIVPEGYPFFLGRGWDIPNRAQRINALLDATPMQSPSAMAAMQGDTLSLMAQDLLPLMLAAPAASGNSAAAVAQLRAWDRRMDRDQAAPLIFAAWLREFNRLVLAGRLGPAFADYWGMHPDVIHRILTTNQDWCDDPATPAVESCNDQLAAALAQALDRLTQHLGADLGQWRWGDAHAAQFTNQFWAHVPVLHDAVAETIPASGGDDTLNRGGTAIRDEEDPFADIHGPTLRMIVDLGDMDAARFMISPGQSGNSLSPHYADLMRRWRDLAYVTLDGGAAGGTLVLAPP